MRTQALVSTRRDARGRALQAGLFARLFGNRRRLRPRSARPSAVQKAASAGSGPVDATFKAIEAMAASGSERPLLYSVNAITTGTDAQGEVTVRLRNGGCINGNGADTDIVIAHEGNPGADYPAKSIAGRRHRPAAKAYRGGLFQRLPGKAAGAAIWWRKKTSPARFQQPPAIG